MPTSDKGPSPCSASLSAALSISAISSSMSEPACSTIHLYVTSNSFVPRGQSGPAVHVLATQHTASSRQHKNVDAHIHSPHPTPMSTLCTRPLSIMMSRTLMTRSVRQGCTGQNSRQVSSEHHSVADTALDHAASSLGVCEQLMSDLNARQQQQDCHSMCCSGNRCCSMPARPLLVHP